MFSSAPINAVIRSVPFIFRSILCIVTSSIFDIESKSAKDIVYKLSTIAHYFAQGKVGSAFDVAASTYGGATVYKRFDPDFLIKELGSKTVKEVAEKEWSGFYAENLKIPDDFILLVGWTLESASTSAMVKQMDGFKNNNREEYNRMYNDIAKLVSDLVSAWKNNKKEWLPNHQLYQANHDLFLLQNQQTNIFLDNKSSELFIRARRIS